MSNTIVTVSADNSELLEWFSLVRERHIEAIEPIDEGDCRAQELADSGAGPSHRTTDPELLARYFWEYCAAPKLPHPPIEWPAWATSAELSAEAWSGGAVVVLISGEKDTHGTHLLLQQRFEFDPNDSTVTKNPAAARITTPTGEDDVWIEFAELEAVEAGCRAARQIFARSAA